MGSFTFDGPPPLPANLWWWIMKSFVLKSQCVWQLINPDNDRFCGFSAFLVWRATEFIINVIYDLERELSSIICEIGFSICHTFILKHHPLLTLFRNLDVENFQYFPKVSRFTAQLPSVYISKVLEQL